MLKLPLPARSAAAASHAPVDQGGSAAANGVARPRRSIASRFDHEKHFAAASFHGSHAYCRCSRRSSTMSTGRGTTKPERHARCSAWCRARSGGASAERSRRRWRSSSRSRRRIVRRRSRFPREVRASRFRRASLPVPGCRSPTASSPERRRAPSTARRGRACRRRPAWKSESSVATSRPAAQLTKTQNGLCRSRQ